MSDKELPESLRPMTIEELLRRQGISREEIQAALAEGLEARMAAERERLGRPKVLTNEEIVNDIGRQARVLAEQQRVRDAEERRAERRDYFASAALTGLLIGYAEQHWDAERIAVNAYGIADAMLAEREKGKS